MNGAVVLYVYADILFLLNTVVCGLLLAAAGRLTCRQVEFHRVSVASLLGGIYSILPLVVNVPLLYALPSRMCFAAIMVAVAYPKAKGFSLAWLTMSFFCCSAMAAGMAYALFRSRGFISQVPALPGGREMASWFAVALSLGMTSLVPSAVRRAGIIGTAGRRPILVSVKISLRGRSIVIPGMVDTGNDLHEPITGLPVVVVELEALRDLVPVEFLDDLSSRRVFDERSWPSWFSTRFRVIPYAQVSGESGFLLGFLPDQIEIAAGGPFTSKPAAVAVAGQCLCPTGLYHALVHPELVA